MIHTPLFALLLEAQRPARQRASGLSPLLVRMCEWLRILR